MLSQVQNILKEIITKNYSFDLQEVDLQDPPKKDL
jgi:hypothetical protein